MAKEAWQENPFRDFLGQEIKAGDFLAQPYKFGRGIRLNILYCEGYNEGGILLRELSRFTGNWVRVYPKTNYNIVRISTDGVDVTKHTTMLTEKAKSNIRMPNEQS